MLKKFFFISFFCLINFSENSSIEDLEDYFQDYFKENNINDELHENFKFCAYHFFQTMISIKVERQKFLLE